MLIFQGVHPSIKNCLVVEPTHLKNMLVKLDHFPRDRGEKKRVWNHHLEQQLHPSIKKNTYLVDDIDIIAISPFWLTLQNILFGCISTCPKFNTWKWWLENYLFFRNHIYFQGQISSLKAPTNWRFLVARILRVVWCIIPVGKSWLHPRKLTCPLKRGYFNRKYIFQPVIFRGHVSFPGGNDGDSDFMTSDDISI